LKATFFVPILTNAGKWILHGYIHKLKSLFHRFDQTGATAISEGTRLEKGEKGCSIVREILRLPPNLLGVTKSWREWEDLGEVLRRRKFIHALKTALFRLQGRQYVMDPVVKTQVSDF